MPNAPSLCTLWYALYIKCVNNDKIENKTCDHYSNMLRSSGCPQYIDIYNSKKKLVSKDHHSER